jgi:hypothetical protein
VTELVPFGTRCTVLVSHKQEGKTSKPWAPRAMSGRIIGRSEEVKGFKVYIPKTNSVVISQHVQNIDGYNDDEIKLIKKLLDNQHVAGDQDDPPVVPPIPIAAGEIAGIPRVSKSKKSKNTKKSKVVESNSTSTSGSEGAHGSEGASPPQLVPSTDPVSSSSPPLPQNSEGVGKAKRTRSKSKKLLEAEASQSKSKPQPQVNVVFDVPQTYRQAKRSPQWPQWQVSMQDEIDSLEDLDTWELCRRDPNVDTLHCKWVYRIKTHADGHVERFKSRIVACGNEQVFGQHYLLKFSPTLSMSTGYVIFGLSLEFNVRPQHGDIPNAYVRAEFEKCFNLMMEVPPGV